MFVCVGLCLGLRAVVVASGSLTFFTFRARPGAREDAMATTLSSLEPWLRALQSVLVMTNAHHSPFIWGP